MELDKRDKKLFATILILMIIATSVLLFVQRDKLLKHEILIEYPDGCNETYINNKLVTPSCNYTEPIYNTGGDDGCNPLNFSGNIVI